MKKFIIALGLTLGLLFSAAPSYAEDRFCGMNKQELAFIQAQGWTAPVPFGEVETKALIRFMTDQGNNMAGIDGVCLAEERSAGMVALLFLSFGEFKGALTAPLSVWRQIEDNVLGRKAETNG